MRNIARRTADAANTGSVTVWLNGTPMHVPPATPIRALQRISNIADTDLVVVEKSGDRRLISAYSGTVGEHGAPLNLEEVASPVRGAPTKRSAPRPLCGRTRRVAEEATVLQRRHRVTWDRDDARWFIFRGVKLPPGYSPQATDIAFSIPSDYPRVVPVGAFLAPGLKLLGQPCAHYFQQIFHRASGQSAEQDEEMKRRGWSWLCVHPKSEHNPKPTRYGLDNVLGSALLMLTQMRDEACRAQNKPIPGPSSAARRTAAPRSRGRR